MKKTIPAAKTQTHLLRASAAISPQSTTEPWACADGSPNEGWVSSALTSGLTQ